MDNLPLTLGGKRRCQRSADGCRLGADGRGDLARYRGPPGRAALARLGGRALGAGKYQAIRFDRPPLLPQTALPETGPHVSTGPALLAGYQRPFPFAFVANDAVGGAPTLQ